MVAEFRLKISTAFKPTNGRKSRALDVGKLKTPEVREKYAMEIRNRFSTLQDSPPEQENVQNVQTATQPTEIQRASRESKIEKRWKHFKDAVLEVGEAVLGFRNKRRKEWISEDTWKKISARKELKIKACSTPPVQVEALQQINDRYRHIHREVKKSIRKDKRTWVEGLAEEAEQAAARQDSRELYRITKILSKKSFSSAKPVRGADGALLINEDQQRKRWEEYFKQLLNPPRQDCSQRERDSLDSQASATPQLQLDGEETYSQPPSEHEILQAIMESKNGRAAGKDNIPAELLKACPKEIAGALQPLFQDAWLHETFPDDWNTGTMVKIPKKGDLTRCDNWRGITLLSVPSKVFTRVILNRIKDVVEGGIRKEQHGFRRNKSCVDLINTVRIILEQSQEYQSPLYLAFIDFVKAFDTIDRSFIWETLENMNLDRKIIRVIRALYENYRCQVEHRGQVTDAFRTNAGVRQGCLLSPLLFILALDQVLRLSERRRKRGVQWQINTRLEDVDYADDICMMAQRFSDIRGKLKDLERAAGKAGLRISSCKTKEIRINSTVDERLRVNNVEVEEVDSFVYLGSVVGKSGGSDEDVEARIKKARGTFSQLWKVWRSPQIRIKTKLRIFNSNVKSVLLYGCETWKESAKLISKLQVFVNRCLRLILGIRWPNTISNAELRRRTGQEEVQTEIKQRKWRWVGHTLRKDEAEIPKTALTWNPQGQRRRGRPRKTWRTTVAQEAKSIGKSWMELRHLAQDRDSWRTTVEALCSTRSNRN